MSQFDPAQHRDDERLSREYVRAVVLSKADEMQRIAAAVGTSSREWVDAAMFTDHELLLDPVEMEGLKRDLLAVIDHYRGHSAPGSDGAQPVVAHLQLYQQP